MQKLVIVESPNKIKKVQHYLEEAQPHHKWVVLASVGHFRELKDAGVDNIGIEDAIGFKPMFQLTPSKTDIVARIKDTAEKSGEILLATDPDREGEGIAWHLTEVLKLKNPTRLTFNEISAEAVKKALNDVRPLDEKLVEAQLTRQILDKMFGYRASSTFQKIDSEMRSIGRVQTPAMRLVFERNEAIENFVPLVYKEFTADLGSKKFSYLGNTSDKEESLDFKELKDGRFDLLFNEVKGYENRATIVKKTSKEAIINAPVGLTTNDILQKGVQLGYSADDTQKYLQNLFTDGLITYLRTDSTHIDPLWVPKARTTIKDMQTVLGIPAESVGTEALHEKKAAANAQEAHEAVRPVDMKNTSAKHLGANEDAIYQFIYHHTKLAMLKPGVDEKLVIIISLGNHYFKGTFTATKDLGWRKFAKDDVVEKSESFSGEVGDKVLAQVNQNQVTTTPPSYLNEGTFLKLLETKGIGRPSTYAATVSKLLERKYLIVDKKRLIVSETGKKILRTAIDGLNDLVKIEYTAQLENKLDQVASGSISRKSVLNDVWILLDEMLHDITETQSINLKALNGICPKCGNHLRSLKDKNQMEFKGCSNWPACDFTKRPDNYKTLLTEKYAKENAEASEKLIKKFGACPDCGNGLDEKTSAKGNKYYACSNWRGGCKHIQYESAVVKQKQEKKLIADAKKSALGACPNCKHPLVEKEGKFGKYVGCDNWRNGCKYIKPKSSSVVRS